MKNVRVFSTLIIFVALLGITACNKNSYESQTDMLSNGLTRAEELSDEIDEPIRCEIDYERIGVEDGRLKFESEDHFNEIHECLVSHFQSNILEIRNQLLQQTDDEDEMDDLLAEGLYDGTYTLDGCFHEFESHFPGFTSIRRALNDQEITWHQSEELLDEEDPFINFIGTYCMRAMFNQDMEALIDREVIKADANRGLQGCDIKGGQSQSWTPASKRRMIGRTVLYRWFGSTNMPGNSNFVAETVAKRKSWWGWHISFVRVKARVAGSARLNCESLRDIEPKTARSYGVAIAKRTLAPFPMGTQMYGFGAVHGAWEYWTEHTYKNSFVQSRTF